MTTRVLYMHNGYMDKELEKAREHLAEARAIMDRVRGVGAPPKAGDKPLHFKYTERTK